MCKWKNNEIKKCLKFNLKLKISPEVTWLILSPDYFKPKITNVFKTNIIYDKILVSIEMQH